MNCNTTIQIQSAHMAYTVILSCNPTDLTTDLSATSLLSKHFPQVLIQFKKQQFFKDFVIQAVVSFAQNDCCCAEQSFNRSTWWNHRSRTI